MIGAVKAVLFLVMFVYCVREYTMCNIVYVIHVSLELDACCCASYAVLCCLEFEHTRYSSGRLLISLEFMSEGVACVCFRHIEVNNGMTAATADTQSLVSCCAKTWLSCSVSISYKLGALITCLVSYCSNNIIPYPTAFPYGNGMVLHFYQQQESSTTKTVHKVINKGLKTYV